LGPQNLTCSWTSGVKKMAKVFENSTISHRVISCTASAIGEKILICSIETKNALKN
jgi:hypothetical protein